MASTSDVGKYIVKLIVYWLPPKDRGFSLRPVYDAGTYVVWKLGLFRIEYWRTPGKVDQ